MCSLLFSDAPFSNAPGPTYYRGKLLQVKYIKSERIVTFLYFSERLGATWRWVCLRRGVCGAVWYNFRLFLALYFVVLFGENHNRNTSQFCSYRCGAVWCTSCACMIYMLDGKSMHQASKSFTNNECICNNDVPFSNVPGPTYYYGKLLKVKYTESERVASFLYFNQRLCVTWRWIGLHRSVRGAVQCGFELFLVLYFTVQFDQNHNHNTPQFCS